MPENKITDTRMMVAFVDKMLTNKGLTLSADERQKLRAAMLSELEIGVEQAIIRALPDEKLAELGELADGPDMTDEKIGALFASSGVDFGAVTAKSMKDYQARFLAMNEAQTKEFVERAVGAQVMALEAAKKAQAEGDNEGREIVGDDEVGEVFMSSGAVWRDGKTEGGEE